MIGAFAVGVVVGLVAGVFVMIVWGGETTDAPPWSGAGMSGGRA